MSALSLATRLSCIAIVYAAAAADVHSLQIRFCPSAQVRTFPMETRREVNGLLLQNVAVVNDGPVSVDVSDVELELLKDGAVMDTRRIAGAELTRAVAAGPALQASGMLKVLAFQFCGSSLIGDDIALAGATLAPRQALLLTQQPFAYRGSRDVLRVRVHGRVDGRGVEETTSLPIRAGFARTPFRFPLRGTWFAAVGPTLHTAHRWALPEEFGYDIAKLGTGGITHRGTGSHFTDYYAYGAPVRAAADGVVVAMANDIGEDVNALRRPGESDEAYATRVQKLQMALLVKGGADIAGNYVMIDHGNGEHSLYAHLVPRSVTVTIGQRVRGGATIGKLGSSGNSTEPHLHFQVCDAPDPLACAGIPVEFQDLALPYADEPRALQSGDIVIAK